MSLPKDTVERFHIVADNFQQEVDTVTDWHAQTPVSEWVARDIIVHLHTWFPAVVRAADVAIDLHADPFENPVDAWNELRESAYAVLRERGSRVITEGNFKGMDLETMIRHGFLNDVFLHTWDLARSQGREPVMDEGAAAASLAAFEERGEALRDGEAFGSAHPVDADAPIVERLMAYIGRDPNFGK